MNSIDNKALILKVKRYQILRDLKRSITEAVLLLFDNVELKFRRLVKSLNIWEKDLLFNELDKSVDFYF